MYPSNQDPTDIPESGAQSEGVSGAWPPAPTTAQSDSGPALTVPFKEEYRRVRGNVSDFRVGNLTLSSQGIDIQGKIALRAEIRVPIFAVTFVLLRVIGGFIALYIMEYGFRRDGSLRVGWDQIQNVVFAPKHHRLCLVFTAPNQSGKEKLFSLAFRLPPQDFGPFLETAKVYVPEKTIEGRIPGATSIIVWVALILLIAVVIAAFVGFGLSSLHR